MKIPIASINVRDRMREDMGDLDALAASIRRFGQLQPIIIDGACNLVAGGRRLAACMQLGASEIEASRLDDLDAVTAIEIELEENLRRKDLNWVEEVTGLKRLFDMRVERYGEKGSILAKMSGGAGYGVADAASDTERSTGAVSMDIALARGLEEYPEIAAEPTKASAFKRYRSLRETALRTEAAKRTRLDDTYPAPLSADEDDLTEGTDAVAYTPMAQTRRITWKGKGMLYLGDSAEILRYLPDASMDLLVTDPPYALGLHKEGATHGGTRLGENVGTMYDDDPHRVMDMLDLVMAQCARVLKGDGHGYVFFHHTMYEPVYLLLRKHFGTCDATPIVWVKNTPGIGDPNRAWVYAYEPCFFINRGRGLVKPQAFNYLKYDTIPPSQKIHPTEKPAALLRHLISASAVMGEVVLDPFGGSGSTLCAAVQNGCRFVGIEKHEPFHRSATERISEVIAEEGEESDVA